MPEAVDLQAAEEKAGGRVLLVEDEADLSEVYGRILSRAGFDVVRIANGCDVLAALGVREFDLVLSDIGLPGMNGIEVLRTVRARDPDLPVVLMTAGRDIDHAVRAVEHGALRYLLKPVDPALLSGTAAEAMRWRQLARVQRRAYELYGQAAGQASRRDELARRFERARATLRMAYQPIVCWSERDIHGYEALVRCDECSLRSPPDLFAAAEDLGRLFDLGRAIRRQVADTMLSHDAHWVFVNIHPADFEDEDLFAPDAPLSRVAQRVVLEVTERASLEHVAGLGERLTALRALGFRLALDDLGAGYAALSSLVQLQPEVVKLDMSLVRNIDSEPAKKRLVLSMNDVCRDLGIQVVAEGVETRAELDALLETGCDLVQGYFFARPGPAFPAVAL